MRLSEAKVDWLAEQIAAMLRGRDDIDRRSDDNRLRALIRQAMVEELSVEDRLDEEIRRLLQQYDREIRAGRMSYNTLFTRIKAQLVRERGIVL